MEVRRRQQCRHWRRPPWRHYWCCTRPLRASSECCLNCSVLFAHCAVRFKRCHSKPQNTRAAGRSQRRLSLDIPQTLLQPARELLLRYSRCAAAANGKVNQARCGAMRCPGSAKLCPDGRQMLWRERRRAGRGVALGGPVAAAAPAPATRRNSRCRRRCWGPCST